MHHTASAERWLRDLGDLGPGWREGVGPASSGVDGGERATKDPQARDGTGPEQQRPPSPRPVPFRAVVDVSGRAQRATNGRRDRDDDRHRAGRTSRIRLGEHSRVRPESPRTGGRDLVARAASTREISQTLFISEYTVQEPLSNVFEKVGVRSRRELVKRFYFDAMYS